MQASRKFRRERFVSRRYTRGRSFCGVMVTSCSSRDRP